MPQQHMNFIGEELDGKGGYMVVDPTTLYRGKSYSDWTCDWVSWFLSSDADRRNSGPVVFLRSKGLPNRLTGAYIPDVPDFSSQNIGSESLPDPVGEDLSTYNRHPYINDPNVKVGGDRLIIFDDQAVFIPIIVAFRFKTDSLTDWGKMQDLAGLTIDYGDNPPEISQLTINGRDIDLPITADQHSQHLIPGIKTDKDLNEKMEALEVAREEELKRIKVAEEDLRNFIKSRREKQQNTLTEDDKANERKELMDKVHKHEQAIAKARYNKINLSRQFNLMERFRIVTPIFNTIIPETEYGRSTKDYIEEAPISPGNYLAMADGYFVMLKFREGSYWIHTWSSAPREGSGPYFSELLYQIEVHARRHPSGRVTRWRPSRNDRLLRQIFVNKRKNGELTEPQTNRLSLYLNSVDMQSGT